MLCAILYVLYKLMRFFKKLYEYIYKYNICVTDMSVQKSEDLLTVVISTELSPSPNSQELFINQEQQVCLLIFYVSYVYLSELSQLI